uniref:Uncharacterized protein n=1 Tax=Caenorhabditis brenneri TaxID=135651 RepID=B6VBI3_CAEBE|nr:hypothetical protein Cbre_JD10.008 [Caenorhabditis brenneri]
MPQKHNLRTTSTKPINLKQIIQTEGGDMYEGKGTTKSGESTQIERKGQMGKGFMASNRGKRGEERQKRNKKSVQTPYEFAHEWTTAPDVEGGESKET